MNDELRLQTHLDEHPNDVQTRRILADLFEEEGRTAEARCQRWLADHQKYPDNKLSNFAKEGWCWWTVPDYPMGLRLHAVVPVSWYDRIPRAQKIAATRVEAERFLAEAMARAEPET